MPKAPVWGQESIHRPSAPRYESLTLWRGAACLGVIFYHSVFTGYGPGMPEGGGPIHTIFLVLSRCWIGVPLFFVLSGYCVLASADAIRVRRKSVASFFWRRFHRIYPPFWIFFAAAIISVYFVEKFASGYFEYIAITNPSALTTGQWLGNLTLTETWRWHFVHGTENCFLRPFWTLCYEEQFYGVVGLVLLFARRFFFTAFAVISLLVFAALFQTFANIQGFFFDGMWLMFAAGILVYFTINYVPSGRRGWYCVPIGIGALSALTDPKQLLVRVANEPNQSYLAAFCFALLLVAIHPWDKKLAEARWLRPLRFCGERCYSLYLIHWPLVTIVAWYFGRLGIHHPLAILFLMLPCCVGTVLAIGAIFHVLVERRFWNPGYARGPVQHETASRAEPQTK